MENPVISCGGFQIDHTSLIEEDGVLKALPGEPKLPHATSADNGKTIRVVDGEWELVSSYAILG